MLTKNSVSRPLYLEAEDIRKKVETSILDYCGFTVVFMRCVRGLTAGKFIFFIFATFAVLIKPESPKRKEKQDAN